MPSERIAKFEKVSFKEFKKSVLETVITSDEQIQEWYDNIKLPQRATTGSAGYDFYAPFDIDIPNESFSIVIPTGIRCKINDGWVLSCYPRSSLGFKYALGLDNTVGIIDSDYYYSSNEGHIKLKLHAKNTVHVDTGKAFSQGIFTPYGITYDDNVTETRDGGFGSTDKK